MTNRPDGPSVILMSTSHDNSRTDVRQPTDRPDYTPDGDYVCAITGEVHPEPHEDHGLDDVEYHDRGANSNLLNKLRAGVLGANDGIVSVGGLVVGVAGGTANTTVLALSGVAAVVSGALSMAMGEYVSVSTQRDSEKALVDRVRAAVRANRAGEHVALVNALEERGIEPELADRVADQLSADDELSAHLTMRYGVDEEMVVSPLAAAVASLIAFILGAIIPLAAILLAPVEWRVPATMAAVVVALAVTGLVSSKLGESASGRATVRTIIGGLGALGVGWLVGMALGGTIGGAHL